MKSIIKITALLLLSAALYSCGGGKEVLDIRVVCTENTNSGNAVVVTFYQLINQERFKFASIDALRKNPLELLGSDLVQNAVLERTMVPNEVYSMDEYEVEAGTRYLGVVADFHSPSGDAWKQIISLEDGFDKLTISVHDNYLSVDRE